MIKHIFFFSVWIQIAEALEISVCYGDQELNCTRYAMQCDSAGITDRTILLTYLQFYRSSHESCFNDLTDCLDENQCCAGLSNETIIYSTAINKQIYQIYKQCSGRTSCLGYMPLLPFGTSKATHMTAIYDCMADADITKFCQESFDEKNIFHLLFNGNETHATDWTDCVCTIESSVDRASISVHPVDIRLQDTSDRCTNSTLAVGVIDYDCMKDHDVFTYHSSIDVTAPTNITLHRNAGNPAMVWIAVQATNGGDITVRCFPAQLSATTVTDKIISPFTDLSTDVIGHNSTTSSITTAVSVADSVSAMPGRDKLPSIWVIIGPILSVAVVATFVSIGIYLCARNRSREKSTNSRTEEDAGTTVTCGVSTDGRDRKAFTNKNEPCLNKTVCIIIEDDDGHTNTEETSCKTILGCGSNDDGQRSLDKTVGRIAEDDGSHQNTDEILCKTVIDNNDIYSYSKESLQSEPANDIIYLDMLLQTTDSNRCHSSDELQQTNNENSFSETDYSEPQQMCPTSKTFKIENDSAKNKNIYSHINKCSDGYNHISFKTLKATDSGKGNSVASDDYNHIFGTHGDGESDDIRGSAFPISLKDILEAREVIFTKAKKKKSATQ